MHQHGGNLFNVTRIYLTSHENDPLKKKVDIIEPKNKPKKKNKEKCQGFLHRGKPLAKRTVRLKIDLCFESML